MEATAREFGLPGSLWLAAQRTGVLELLQSLWPLSRSGPSPAHYLLLAAIHRVCRPGPKTEVANRYDRTILRSQWGFAPERFTSQEFWDCFDRIPEEQLEQAQIRLLGLWNQKQWVGRRLLAYDTTNFYTYAASTNARNTLAQRGPDKQGRPNVRQVGLSYVLDGENGMSLCHRVYPGNAADADELPEALSRIVVLLDRNRIARDTVTLVLDKGAAAVANPLELEKAGAGWISALPWNQAPAELRDKSVEQLPACSEARPGVRAAAGKMLIQGKEYLCVLGYSVCFASEQLHSLSATLAKVAQNLRRLAAALSKPLARFTGPG
ncbi:MAG: IS1634 family transposase, partial [Gammaproteobacteria bacterium]